MLQDETWAWAFVVHQLINSYRKKQGNKKDSEAMFVSSESIYEKYFTPNKVFGWNGI